MRPDPPVSIHTVIRFVHSSPEQIFIVLGDRLSNDLRHRSVLTLGKFGKFGMRLLFHSDAGRFHRNLLLVEHGL